MKPHLARRLAAVRRRARRRPATRPPRSRRSTRRSPRCATPRSQRRLCLGHHRRADDRGRPAPRRRPRPRPAPATGRSPSSTAMGFANVHVEPFDMPVWTRGAESASRSSRPSRRSWWSPRSATAPRPAPRASPAKSSASTALDALEAAPDSAVRGKIVFVDHAMPRDAGRLGLRLVRRPAPPGPDHRQPQGRDRRSSSARSAPTITATRTPASRHFADGAKPIPAGALPLPDAEQLAAHPQARQAGRRCT